MSQSNTSKFNPSHSLLRKKKFDLREILSQEQKWKALPLSERVSDGGPQYLELHFELGLSNAKVTLLQSFCLVNVYLKIH